MKYIYCYTGIHRIINLVTSATSYTYTTASVKFTKVWSLVTTPAIYLYVGMKVNILAPIGTYWKTVTRNIVSWTQKVVSSTTWTQKVVSSTTWTEKNRGQ